MRDHSPHLQGDPFAVPLQTLLALCVVDASKSHNLALINQRNLNWPSHCKNNKNKFRNIANANQKNMCNASGLMEKSTRNLLHFFRHFSTEEAILYCVSILNAQR